MHLTKPRSFSTSIASRREIRGGRLPRGRGRWLLAVVAATLAAIPVHAANRAVRIDAPATARAGSLINVSIQASTDAAGEKIGFLHSEYSVDGGTKWVPIAFEADQGARKERQASIKAGGAGSTVLVRVRVAFRGGKAGDVDFAGKAIDWDGSWAKWAAPPTRTARVRIVAG